MSGLGLGVGGEDTGSSALANVHIMHVIDRLAVGGAERMLVDLVNQAAADGYRVSVCLTRSGGELKADLAPEIEVVELGRERRFDWKAFKAFSQLIRKRRVDVLHVHGRPSLSMLSLLKATRLVSIPLLFHDHYGRIEIDRSVPRWFRIAGRHMLNEYVGVYEELGTWARAAGIKPDSVHVIGNSLDLTRFSNASDSPEADDIFAGLCHPVGITIAGIRHEKGIDTLLGAVANIRRDLKFSILIVGADSDIEYAKRCRALCSQLQIDDRVVFAGQRTDVPELLRRSDFAVVSSRSESGPLVLIEFMACGVPFVATEVGDVSKKIRGLGLLEFIPPDNVGALAKGMETLIRLSDDERRARGSVGRYTAEQHFNIRTAAARWYDLYRRMVST